VVSVNGSLSVRAGGQFGTWSVIINGQVLPAGQLTVLGTLPGGCLFNGGLCFGTLGSNFPSIINAYFNPAISQSSLQGLSDLAPQGQVQYVCNNLLRTKCRLLIGDSPVAEESALSPNQPMPSPPDVARQF
jgi:hypothetical protein